MEGAFELRQIYPIEHYRTKIKHYKIATRRIFKVLIDEETSERWAELIALGRALDNYIDAGSWQTLPVRTAQATSFLSDAEAVSRYYPALSLDRLGPGVYGRLCSLAQGIFSLSEAYKSTTDLNEYIRFRKTEAQLYAMQIIGVATPQVTGQENFNQFSDWFTRVGIATNLYNSFTDLRAEYEAGEVAMQPTQSTRLRLLGAATLAICNADSFASID